MNPCPTLQVRDYSCTWVLPRARVFESTDQSPRALTRVGRLEAPCRAATLITYVLLVHSFMERQRLQHRGRQHHLAALWAAAIFP